MGKDTPAPPTPPDPKETAAAQSTLSQSTATTNQLLNMVDQYGPNGSLVYNQTGTNSFTDADGKTYTIPKFSATTTLSPEQQVLQGLTNKTQQNLGQIGVDQSAKIGSLLGTNLKLGNEASEARLFELGSKRLDPLFARREDALRTRLVNQGIQPGSAAWNAEMTQFGQGQNDAYNELLLTGRGQANQEIMAERNAPINEITALMSGSQVSNPTFNNTPTTSVGGVDYGGMVRDSFNGQMAGYNAQMSQQNAAMGGMFGLGGTLMGGAMKYGFNPLAWSDRRLKSNIVRVGESSGFPIYEYDIFGRRERGVMADEVELRMPGAVHIHPSGYKMVDYAMIGVTR